MSNENTGLVDYYKNLLIMQYHDKPNARAHIQALIEESMIYDVAVSVREGFNPNTAVGAQQDSIAKYLGVKRTVSGTTFTRTYYGYALYGAVSPFLFSPMIKYGDAPPDVQFRDYKESETSLYDLNDEEFRIIQKLAIVRNNSNASVKDIDDIITALFGAECYFIDRMNMTVVSYMVGARWSRIFTIAKSEGLLPNPAGVGTALVVVPDIEHIFSYSLYGGAKPAFAVGYGNYFGEWETVGNSKTISYGYIAISALSSDRLAFCSQEEKILYTYDFDGTDYQLTGNKFDFGLLFNNPSLTTLASTRIALIDSGYDKLRTYDFDGTDWTLVGNELSIYNVGPTAMAALSSSRIALANSNTGKLGTYDFDGTNWTLVGNELSISGINYPSMASLSSTRIALVDTGTWDLRTYNFDGTNWSLVGNVLHFSGSIAYFSISALSSSRISLVDRTSGKLRNYDFDGTDWFLVGPETDLGDINFSSMATFLPTRIAFADSYNQKLQSYDLVRDLSGCLASYS